MSRTFIRPCYISVCLAATLTACQPQLPRTSSPKQIISILILADASASSGDLTSITDQRCPEILAQAHHALSLPSAKHLDIAIYATGDINRTSGEPTAILPWTRFSKTHHLFGKHASLEDQQKNFLSLVDEHCRKNLHSTAGSPIVLGLQRSIESLAAHKAELTNHQEQVAAEHLSLLSDLRDNYDPAVDQYSAAVALALKQGKPRPPRPANLPHIDLRELKISLCGISEHLAEKGESAFTAQALPLIWQEILGSKHTPLTFDASCPRETVPRAIASKDEVRP